jgi:hypothetical protein
VTGRILDSAKTSSEQKTVRRRKTRNRLAGGTYAGASHAELNPAQTNGVEMRIGALLAWDLEAIENYSAKTKTEQQRTGCRPANEEKRRRMRKSTPGTEIILWEMNSGELEMKTETKQKEHESKSDRRWTDQHQRSQKRGNTKIRLAGRRELQGANTKLGRRPVTSLTDREN